MSHRNALSPANSLPPEPQPCHVCGNSFQNSPNNVVKIVSEGERAILQIELGVKIAMPPNSQKPPEYAPVPICISCVHMIVSNAFKSLAAKAAAPVVKPEQN